MQESPRYRKTRIAPTPSGYLHIGNAYSFLLTHQLAQASRSAMLLRIDDLDGPRVRKEYLTDIFETLQFLQIEVDEGPTDLADFQDSYSQLQRTSLYTTALTELRKADVVYACCCSRKMLAQAVCDCETARFDLDEPGITWRMKAFERAAVVLKNFDGSSLKVPVPEGMNRMVVRKKDGQPSYHLASVVDDRYFGVDLVVRGEDLFHSTLGQLWVSQHLAGNNFGNTAFYHHSLVEDADGKKLSKSSGAESLKAFRAGGGTLSDLYTLLERKYGISLSR